MICVLTNFTHYRNIHILAWVIFKISQFIIYKPSNIIYTSFIFNILHIYNYQGEQVIGQTDQEPFQGEGTQGECVIGANEPDTILSTVQIGEYLCYSQYSSAQNYSVRNNQDCTCFIQCLNRVSQTLYFGLAEVSLLSYQSVQSCRTRYDNVTLSPFLLPARVTNRSHSMFFVLIPL